MNDARGADIVLYGIMILLPLSALIARRPGLVATARMALAWVGIFGVGLLLASQRDRLVSVAHTLFSDQQVTGSDTHIRMADDGHFYADVIVNGVSRRMLIDSGATTTALSIATAKAAGIDIDESPFPTVLDTANGQITARVSTVKSVSIGAIATTDLAVVVSPSFGDSDVIGMNMLSRLRSWRVEGRTLILNPNP